MSRVEQRLKELGLTLPQPLQLPPGIVLPFPWVRVVGARALFSGHGPTIPVEIEGAVELRYRLPVDSAA